MSKILKRTVLVAAALTTVAIGVLSNKTKLKAKLKQEINDKGDLLEKKGELRKKLNRKKLVFDAQVSDEVESNHEEQKFESVPQEDEAAQNTAKTQTASSVSETITPDQNEVVTKIEQEISPILNDVLEKNDDKSVNLKDLSHLAKERMKKFNSK